MNSRQREPIFTGRFRHLSGRKMPRGIFYRDAYSSANAIRPLQGRIAMRPLQGDSCRPLQYGMADRWFPACFGGKVRKLNVPNTTNALIVNFNNGNVNNNNKTNAYYVRPVRGGA